jgi:hypothetical protein
MTMAKEKAVENVNPVLIQTYLADTDHKETIKKMMISLFKGQTRTISEWKVVDENINKRRVK